MCFRSPKLCVVMRTRLHMALYISQLVLMSSALLLSNPNSLTIASSHLPVTL